MDSGIEIKKKRKPLVALNTILCVILLFVVTVSIISGISFREIFKNNLPAKAVAQVSNEDASEFLYNYINDDRISEDNIADIVSDMNVQDFASEQVSNYDSYLLNGESENDLLTADVISDYINENNDVIKKETKLKYVTKDDDYIKKITEKPLNNFNSTLEKNINVINSLVSLPFIILMIVIMALIFAQWCFIYAKNSVSVRKLFKIYSITLLVPSVIIAVAALFMNFIIKVSLPDKFDFITGYTSEIRKTFLENSGIIIAAGLALMIIYLTMTLIVNAVNNKKTRKTSAVAYAGNPEPNTTTVTDTPNLNNTTTDSNTQSPEDNADNTQSVVSNENNNAENNLNSVPDNNQNVTALNSASNGPEEETDLKKIKFCTNCGKKLFKDAIFCDQCGHKMN